MCSKCCPSWGRGDGGSLLDGEPGGMVAEMRSAAGVLTRTVDEQTTELCTLTERLEKGLTAVLERAEAVEATPLVVRGSPSHASVAAATPRGMTAEHAAVLARSARMARQILVDSSAEGAVSSLGGLTELELKEKANLALTMMEEKMEGATFVGASRLANGGVIFDCKDEATAEWVRQTHVVRQFVAALGSNCVYRPRRTELIAEMVGVEARVEEAGFWRVVETDSGITEGGIESARWIKAVERRTPGQRVAHLRVAFANAEAANHAIDNGLFVQGRHVRVPLRSRRERKRPRGSGTECARAPADWREDARDKEEAAAPTMVGRDDAGLSTRRGASTPARRCGRAPWLTRFSVRQGHELLRGQDLGEMSGRQNDTAPRMEDGEIPQQWGDLQQQDGLPPLSTLDAFRIPSIMVTDATPPSSQTAGNQLMGTNPSFLQGPARTVGGRHV
ncbi:RNA-directed DNA polymerase from transposon X-element [Mycena sanguinolenta]|uniref:RNA-directed DNA polymerase from transposon X-element n=1 Tax=Mycena sanguinolenta TaxID=230812 RepID=A0A8H6Y270_9AGAR|nr:RNA-directed DNA polymerase from transposon X-element [Mycena sanguinolenta]